MELTEFYNVRQQSHDYKVLIHLLERTTKLNAPHLSVRHFFLVGVPLIVYSPFDQS